MNDFYDILQSRRDTRHFTADTVPDEVIEKALQAGHYAPSVGLTDATKYFLIRSKELKTAIKELFVEYDLKAANQTDTASQKRQYQNLKLEAIEEAPLGLIICYDRSVLNHFTIGTVGSNEALKFSAVCAAQNIWLSLTQQGYSMGWVSILNYFKFKKLLGFPDHLEPLGYFCVGKPATNYDNQPMLQQLHWKQKSKKPCVSEIEIFQKLDNENHSGIPDFETESSTLEQQLQYKIDHKTKPTGALGILEVLAKQIGMVFQSLTPQIKQPAIVVFAADHGIATHGVSAYPQDVTRQMVANFLEGGAAINVFCKQHDIQLSIVDAGVNYDFPPNAKLINAKIDKGTQSYLHGPAMSKSQMKLCFEKGLEIVKQIAVSGSNCIGFGEMGIGNTSTASVLMSCITGIPVEQCVGKGTGVNDQTLKFKTDLLQKALNSYQGIDDLDSKLAYFGGFEILQMAGAMLEAYQHKMMILVDGFIATVAFLIAYEKQPSIRKNAIFSHVSAEQAHIKLLDYLNVKAILQLDLRLGEGTGCAVVFPIVQSAVAFLNDMSSFESAGVSTKV